MSRFNFRNFRVSLGTVLTLALVGLIGSAPANADIWPGLEEQRCMADAFGGTLNCTANDVEITNVNPIDGNGNRATLPDGTANPDYDAVECVQGSTFQLNADLTIRTNANERWDTTFYMPLNDKSPMDLQNNQPNCSLAVPDPRDISTELDLYGNTQPAYIDLDSDECADITKALGPDQYTLYDEQITMYCQASPDEPGKALFTYCAAWENKTGDNCYADVTEDSPNGYYGQVPSQKSKCKCDAFTIEVFLKPDPPAITKTLVSPTPGTRPEPGGVYTFDLSFTNDNDSSSIFVSSLTDEIDITGDGLYDVTLDLWGTLSSAGPADGIYLTDSTCEKPAAGETLVEVFPKGTYSCQIEVTIVDTDLPDDQSPEIYDDVIMVALEDKNGEPVVNGDTCPTALGAEDGEHCSNVVQVKVTNVEPSITITKTPSPDEVLEPGGDVTFTIEVTSTSGTYDDPLTLDSLVDTDFGDLNGVGTCVTGSSVSFSLGSPYTCTFTEEISGDYGDPAHSNTVTAVAFDNESDTDTKSATASVAINDVPSAITLTKTAVPDQVLETGDSSETRDVAYTFLFSVDPAGVDYVIFDTLEDVSWWNDESMDDGVLIDRTSSCTVDTKNGVPLAEPVPLSSGFRLDPGENASCTITLALQGNADDVRHNTATIYGTDQDDVPLHASASEDVTFLDAPLDIAPKFAMKAIAFVHLHNGGVDDAQITKITLLNANVVDGGGLGGQFDILNEADTITEVYDNGYVESPYGPYPFCAVDDVIPAGADYDCAFTLKLYPGFDPNTAIDVDSVKEGSGLIFTLWDGDGEVTTDAKDIKVTEIKFLTTN